MAVRAVAQLSDVDSGFTRTLVRRYQRFGVFTPEDAARISKTGKAVALRFRNTELLKEPVALRELKVAAAASGKSLILQSASIVSPDFFTEVYSEGSFGRR
jgi:hypothetical protein